MSAPAARLRILLVAHSNAHWTPLYARYLHERGHAVLVASFAPEPIDGVRVAHLVAATGPYQPRLHHFASGALRLRRIARDFDPDVVFAPYLASNGLAARLATRAPRVVSVRGGDLLPQVEHAAWRRAVANAVARAACGGAARVHCVAEPLRARLVALGVPRDPIEVSPFGADLALHRPAPTSPSPLRWISTRRQVPNTDLPTLLDAIARTRAAGCEAFCTIGGGGPLLAAHRARAEALGLGERVRFRGELSPSALAAELRESAIYVSTGLSDGASASLHEAMATGLLPVATRIDANAAWIADGDTGLLYRPGDADDLARCLLRAVADAPLRERARRLNPERVARDASRAIHLAHVAALLEDSARTPHR